MAVACLRLILPPPRALSISFPQYLPSPLLSSFITLCFSQNTRKAIPYEINAHRYDRGKPRSVMRGESTQYSVVVSIVGTYVSRYSESAVLQVRLHGEVPRMQVSIVLRLSSPAPIA